MTKVVGVIIDDSETWHAPGVVQDYTTLCGIDADDPRVGHGGTCTPAKGQKITCSGCHQIWRDTLALKLKESDFAPLPYDE